MARSIYHVDSAAACRRIAEKVLETLHTGARSPRSKQLGALHTYIRAHFATGVVSNGGTKAIIGVVEKTPRLAHGIRNFTNYRLRIFLAADGARAAVVAAHTESGSNHADLRGAHLV